MFLLFFSVFAQEKLTQVDERAQWESARETSLSPFDCLTRVHAKYERIALLNCRLSQAIFERVTFAID